MLSKRVASAVAAMAVIAATVGAIVPGGQSFGPTVPAPAMRRAEVAVDAMLRYFYLPGMGLLASYVGPEPEGHLAHVWGYAWALRAVEDVARLPGGERYLPLVRVLADNLQGYWDATARVPAYAPTFSPGPDAVKYFDDNAWVGLDLVIAFDLTGDPDYLAQAEAVFAFETTGWNRESGGIYWSDLRQTRNTASSAPAAQLAARLYLETHERSYLGWAQRIFRWEAATLVDGHTGQVYGNIDRAGNVSQSAWTYNQGSLIGAAVLLRRATGRGAYLQAARSTEGFVQRNLVRPDGTLVPPAEFGGVLADDLALLYDQTRDPALAELVVHNAESAWRSARSPIGLFGNDWSGPPPDLQGFPLLTQSGAVRLLAVAAAVERETAGSRRGPWQLAVRVTRRAVGRNGT